MKETSTVVKLRYCCPIEKLCVRDITKLSGYPRSTVKTRLEQSNLFLASGSLSLQPLLELDSKSTFLSSGLWMLPKKCDTICRHIACSQILFCPFYLILLQIFSRSFAAFSIKSTLTYKEL